MSLSCYCFGTRLMTDKMCELVRYKNSSCPYSELIRIARLVSRFTQENQFEGQCGQSANGAQDKTLIGYAIGSRILHAKFWRLSADSLKVTTQMAYRLRSLNSRLPQSCFMGNNCNSHPILLQCGRE